MWSQVLSVSGAVFVLIAFAANQLKRLSPTTCCSIQVVEPGRRDDSVPRASIGVREPGLMEGSWAVINLFGLIRVLRQTGVATRVPRVVGARHARRYTDVSGTVTSSTEWASPRAGADAHAFLRISLSVRGLELHQFLRPSSARRSRAPPDCRINWLDAPNGTPQSLAGVAGRDLRRDDHGRLLAALTGSRPPVIGGEHRSSSDPIARRRARRRARSRSRARARCRASRSPRARRSASRRARAPGARVSGARTSSTKCSTSSGMSSRRSRSGGGRSG